MRGIKAEQRRTPVASVVITIIITITITIATLLRLDFNVLTIAPPATSGLCSSTDYFHVHSKAFSPPHTSSNI